MELDRVQAKDKIENSICDGTSDPPRSTHRRTIGGAVTTPNARNIDCSEKDGRPIPHLIHKSY